MTQITLIHGDDTAKSREALLKEKATYKDTEFIVLSGKTLTQNELIVASETSSLFGENKCIIIENFFKANKDLIKQFLSYLSSGNCIYPVIIWEDRKLEAKSVKTKFPQARIITCNFPASLFNFLDSLGLTTPQKLLTGFRDSLREIEDALILTMLYRQLRLLILAKDNPSLLNEIGVAPWQGGKLVRQANAWDSQKLLDNYRQLIAIDYRIKSGQTPLKLSQLLDFWLVTL